MIKFDNNRTVGDYGLTNVVIAIFNIARTLGLSFL